MKTILKILFIIFLIWITIAIYLLTVNYEKAPIIMGLCVMYMAFVLMPVFIYYRYKNGKYKKYIIKKEN